MWQKFKKYALKDSFQGPAANCVALQSETSYIARIVKVVVVNKVVEVDEVVGEPHACPPQDWPHGGQS